MSDSDVPISESSSIGKSSPPEKTQTIISDLPSDEEKKIEINDNHGFLSNELNLDQSSTMPEPESKPGKLIIDEPSFKSDSSDSPKQKEEKRTEEKDPKSMTISLKNKQFQPIEDPEMYDEDGYKDTDHSPRVLESKKTFNPAYKEPQQQPEVQKSGCCLLI